MPDETSIPTEAEHSAAAPSVGRFAATASFGRFAPASLPEVYAPRGNLMTAMDAAAVNRFVYLGAQAGSGKTVSALLWIAASGRKAVWFGLDRYDNSPVVFYKALASGLFSAQPDNEAMYAVLMSEGFAASPVEHAIELIAGMHADDHARVLVIDDLQLITSAEIIKSLPLVLKRLPENFIVLCLSRYEFPREWTDFVRDSESTVIKPELLRFSKEEIAWYFDHMGKPVTSEESDFACQVTEGWAMGVNALAHGGQMETEGKALSFTHYFETGLWDTWEPALRHFCLCTSVVDEFDTEFAAVLTGRSNAGAILEHLAETNSFVSRLHEDTYRYHHLFLDFLRERASRSPRVNTEVLHKRAARHYRKNKDYSRALRSWADSGDFKGIDTYLYKFLFDNQKEVIAQYSDFLRSVFEKDFPGKAYGTAPALHALSAWYYYLRGDHERFEAHMDSVYENLPRIALGGRKFVEFAIAAYSTDYRTSILQKVKRFKRFEPYTKLFTRDGLGANVVSITHNMPYLHKSNIDYSDIALEDGALDRLGTTFGVLLGPEWRYIKPCLSAGFHYERDRLDAAFRDNEEALALFDKKNRIEGRICILILRHSILWRLGRKDEAEKTLETLRETTRAKATFFIPNLAAYERRLSLTDGDTEAARAWLRNYFVTETEKTEMLSAFRDFTTARAYIVLGEPDKAHEMIERLKRFAGNFHRPLDLCEACVLESALLWAEGRRAEAAVALTRALETARPYGFVRTIADEGASILPVLKRLAAAVRQPDYAGPLSRQTIGEIMLSAHGVAKSHKGVTANIGKRKDKSVKLSKRQLQMLTLLSQGYGNTQISEITGLAIPTVKTHLFYAYQKLSVNNAMDAVLRARELGWIER